jgi:hypothetical protein
MKEQKNVSSKEVELEKNKKVQSNNEIKKFIFRIITEPKFNLLSSLKLFSLNLNRKNRFETI